MPSAAVPRLRRRSAAPAGHHPSAAVLIGAGLVLGVVGGWVAGLVRVRTP